jgi:hypothetical protein
MKLHLYALDNIYDLSSPDKITTFFVPSDGVMQKIPRQQIDKLKKDSVKLQVVRFLL